MHLAHNKFSNHHLLVFADSWQEANGDRKGKDDGGSGNKQGVYLRRWERMRSSQKRRKSKSRIGEVKTKDANQIVWF